MIISVPAYVSKVTFEFWSFNFAELNVSNEIIENGYMIHCLVRGIKKNMLILSWKNMLILFWYIDGTFKYSSCTKLRSKKSLLWWFLRKVEKLLYLIMFYILLLYKSVILFKTSKCIWIKSISFTGQIVLLRQLQAFEKVWHTISKYCFESKDC